MSQGARTLSPKARKLLVIIGLLIIPLSAGFLLLRRSLRKEGWLRVFRRSEYSNFEPWVIAQSKHETNNWRSSLFRDYNNLFGMKTSRVVKWKGYDGPAADDGGTYAGYDTYADSAQHLINWLRYMNIPSDITTVEQYVNALRARGYFTDSFENYLNGLKRFL